MVFLSNYEWSNFLSYFPLSDLTLFGPGFFYCLNFQEGVFRDNPLKSQDPFRLAQWNSAQI